MAEIKTVSAYALSFGNVIELLHFRIISFRIKKEFLPLLTRLLIAFV